MNLGQIGDNSFIVDTQLKLPIHTATLTLDLRIHSRNKIQMLVPRLKALQLPIDILSICQFLSVLHELLARVDVAVDGEGTEAVGEGEVVQRRGVLLQLATPVLGVPHNLNYLNPDCFTFCLY